MTNCAKGMVGYISSGYEGSGGVDSYDSGMGLTMRERCGWISPLKASLNFI